MKTLRLMSLLFVAALSLGLSSCGDDDDDVDLNEDFFKGSYSQCWSINEAYNGKSEIVSYIKFYSTGDGQDYEIRDGETSGRIIGHYDYSPSAKTLTLTPVVYLGSGWDESYDSVTYRITHVTKSSVTLTDGFDELILKKIDYQTYKDAVEK